MQENTQTYIFRSSQNCVLIYVSAALIYCCLEIFSSSDRGFLICLFLEGKILCLGCFCMYMLLLHHSQELLAKLLGRKSELCHWLKLVWMNLKLEGSACQTGWSDCNGWDAGGKYSFLQLADINRWLGSFSSFQNVLEEELAAESVAVENLVECIEALVEASKHCNFCCDQWQTLNIRWYVQVSKVICQNCKDEKVEAG